MRINLLSRVKLGSMARLLPALLVLAATPGVRAATGPIVFSGLDTKFGGAFQSALSLATDAAGNLYVSEPSQNRVRKVAPDGTRTDLIFTVPLLIPRGLVVDSSNNLWVANNGSTTLVRHPLGGGADAVLTGFSRPIGLAIDAAGTTLYVSSQGSGGTIDKVTGCGVGVAGCALQRLSSGFGGAIRGIAVDTSDNLFVALITTNVLDISATTGAAKGSFSFCKPRDVAVDPAGDLFIACNDKTVVYRIPNEAGVLNPNNKSIIGTSAIPPNAGVHGLAYNNGVLYASSNTTVVDKIQLGTVNLGSFLIGSPFATLATTVALNFYATASSTLGSVVAYTEGILQSDPNGPADYQIGGTGTTCRVNGGTFGAGTLCTITLRFFPNAVGVRHGGIVFSSTSNPQQPIFTLPIFATGLGSRVAYGPGNVINGFNPTVAKKTFSGPVAIQNDGLGNRFVVDLLNNRVVKFNQQLGAASEVGTGLTLPNGVAVDGTGNVYIADGVKGIVKVPNERGVLNSAHQTVVIPGGLLPTNVNFPAGIRFDSAQNLYVADTFNNRILKIPNENGNLNPLNQQVIGSGFIQPNGVATDSAGNVFVADTGHNLVVKVAPDGTQTNVPIDITQIANVGLDAPSDVILDAADDLYISDTNNYRVIYVSSANNNGVQSVVPGAQALVLQPDGTLAGAFGGLWIDPVGNVYVADFSANRIEEVENTPYSLVFPATTVGTTSAPQVIAATNIGNVPLNIKGLDFPPDFTQQPAGTGLTPDCTGTTVLAPGTNCLIGVAFRPPSKGVTIQETLGVENTDLNASGTPGDPLVTDPFPLSGTGK